MGKIGKHCTRIQTTWEQEKKLNLLLTACVSGNILKKVEKCWSGQQSYLEEFNLGHFTHARWQDLTDLLHMLTDLSLYKVFNHLRLPTGLPWWPKWLKISLQCGRPGFHPWGGKIPWGNERLPTPEFWPGEFHGLYSPWGHKESDTTEELSLSLTNDEFTY